MAANFDTLHQAVKAKLDTLKGSGKPLSVVYDYHETAPAGFPAATVEPSAHSGIAFTNTDNLRSYSFDILVFQEFSTTTRSNAVAILRKTIDSIVAAFDADFSLGGTCDYCNQLPSRWGFMEGANGSMLWAELVLVCNAEIAT